VKQPKYTLYKIFDKCGFLLYLGRTKQPLQNRIRGHLFAKPMHRIIDVDHVGRIEYAEFQTEADMNLYEIYYILTLKPPLNVDDKTKDYPTVTLPEVEWTEFSCSLWPKWLDQIHAEREKGRSAWSRLREIEEQRRVIRSRYRVGEITEEECEDALEALEKEREQISDAVAKYAASW